MHGNYFYDNLNDILENVKTSEVTSIFFPYLRKSILIDLRSNDSDGPAVILTDMVSTPQERIRSLKQLRPNLHIKDYCKAVELLINAETNKIASNFFKKARQESKIKSIIGPALESINNLKKKKQKFDLVFIDADKENYKNYYNQSLDLIEKNGLIIVDNVLWHGEVVDTKKQDKLTTAIREFNTYVNRDKRTENLIIPVGDGLTVCRKL